ncbi:DUF2243 domain-containing protein [Rhodospirillum centenum]|uniref:DUF2243 domain-containing protein n=1 Tax=Rhodospirillum centenum (strain ATCC 51521 / SW) TaxID=414684 RepID=B6ITC1_RHOCS|nr:DUF2243 domain-containing protein [Rhodospirillum centenum]ACI99139.1 conserved hypothetical protein [Rhodospirillum centenum SW]
MTAIADAAVADPLGRGSPGLIRAGGLLGFALGGFFDGILLHQILQWHHLLSALEGAAFADLRVQVLADGLFHAAMYVIAGVGLWLLWRQRARFSRPGADRVLAGAALVGFGVWHLTDAVLFHWTLGFHRIRMDTASPLAWDLLWFVVFGLGPVVLGLLLGRGAGRGGGSSGPGSGRLRRGTVFPLLLAAAVLVGGPVAARAPDDGTGFVTVLFPSGLSPRDGFLVAADLDARVVWSSADGQVWMLDLPDPSRVHRVYARGGWIVAGIGLPAGCFSFARPA